MSARTEPMSWETIANEIGIDGRHLRRLRKELGAPAEPDLAAWRAWMDQRRSQREGPDELKADLLREQIRKLRLANDALEKQLVPIDEVFAALRPTLAAFRTALDNLAHRASLKLGGDYQETVEVIQSEVDIALRTFQGAAWFDEQVVVDLPAVQVDTSDIPPAEGQAKPARKTAKPKK
jgi:hypothetical protein